MSQATLSVRDMTRRHRYTPIFKQNYLDQPKRSDMVIHGARTGRFEPTLSEQQGSRGDSPADRPAGGRVLPPESDQGGAGRGKAAKGEDQ